MDPGPSKPTLLKAETRPITERWEVAFVYGFIVKFAPGLRKKLGLNTPTEYVLQPFSNDVPLTGLLICFFFSFEDALLASGRSPALTGVLDHFLHNLWWRQAKAKCDCRSVVQSV